MSVYEYVFKVYFFHLLSSHENAIKMGKGVALSVWLPLFFLCDAVGWVYSKEIYLRLSLAA